MGEFLGFLSELSDGKLVGFGIIFLVALAIIFNGLVDIANSFKNKK